MSERVFAKHDEIAGQPPVGSWRDAAACQGMDTERFFSDDRDMVESAVLVCASCPVAADCLQAALEGREQHGVWGGVTAAERRTMRRREREARLSA